MANETTFQKAAEEVQKLSKKPESSELLALYGLYKQATEGDVKGSRPGMLDLVGRKKYDAWASLKGTAKAAAEKKYVSLVETLKKKYS